jgi:uncharacterized protein (TIGR00296 family)
MGTGEEAVRLARSTIGLWIREKRIFSPKKLSRRFSEKSGAFTTIHSYPSRDLRGCIGYPLPVYPLKDAIIRSAIEATNDPRFPRLEANELDGIIVEVSILTKPELLEGDPKDYPKKIVIGKHGIIVKKDFYTGLLLPQVAKEHGFGKEEFLEHTCIKAGLPPKSWQASEVYLFESMIFSEEKPSGRIFRVL